MSRFLSLQLLYRVFFAVLLGRLLQNDADVFASKRNIVEALALALHGATHVEKINSAFYQRSTLKVLKEGDSALSAREPA